MAAQLLAFIALCVLTVSPLVQAFGTVNSIGQMSEHERITRDALACAPGLKSTGDCFEPRSIDALAGKKGATGAVSTFFESSIYCYFSDSENRWEHQTSTRHSLH